MHFSARMNDQKLIEALLARAEEDARGFRRQHPDDVPTAQWIDNSYTAALPLARDHSGIDPGPGPHPRLFDAYREHIDAILGERVSRRDADHELIQQPTPGEH
jgi:hypothetical protein